MNDLIDMFTPYMYMFTFLTSISITLYALFKGVNWVNILILNIIISIIFNFIGLGGYDLLSNLVTYIIDLLNQIVDVIVGVILDPITDFLENLFSFDWWPW